jgi:hypothetical protein
MNCKNQTQENCLPPNCKYANGQKRKYCRRSSNRVVKEKQNNTRKIGICKGLTKNNCFKPCKFVDTPKRQYCRISGKKVIDKVVKAAKTINNFIYNKVSKKSVKKSLSKEEKAALLINKIVNKNRDKITANFLKTVCSDSGVCITFGKEIAKINEFFNLFHNFDYLRHRRVLKSGGNGTIIKLEYERQKYKSFAILKKTLNASSDSLMYEYMVGRFFVNEVYKKFPSFLQTYGFINSDSFNNLKHHKVLNLDESNIDVGIRLSCMNPSKIMLLIENVSNPISLFYKLTHSYDFEINDFLENEIFSVLFQVYYTLNVLKDSFTHYDLHSDNILLYEPIKDSYIEYHYHYQDQIITFKSIYIVKIIDYGRCFIRNDVMDSNIIYDRLCNIIECNNGERCGSNSGYTLFSRTNTLAELKRHYYINKLNNNQSHDLRLLKDLNNHLDWGDLDTSGISRDIKDGLNYLLKEIKYDSHYGTSQVKRSGLPIIINNVSDAFEYIKVLISSISTPTYADLNKIGDLYIYDDGRDMVFREA